MAQIGRISGPLLEENLLRNGVDLAFRNDLDTPRLLFLDVTNGRIGVSTDTPSNFLEINGTTKTTNLISDNARIAGFDISNATFSAIGNINLDAKEAIVMSAMDNGTLFFDGNFIATRSSNASIDLTPNGTGEINIVNDLNVYGDLYTPGNITLDGTITFGNQNDDAVDFNADVNSNIVPDQSTIYDLGSSTKRWDTLYTNLVNGQEVTTTGLVIDGIDLLTEIGNVIYVSQNGTDTNKGDHVLAPVASIKRALELVEASTNAPTTIYVFPGDYEEETPLVVPANVSIKGVDIRNVKVFPTSYTLSEDVFHLNDTTTISDITIKNFYYDSVNNKGHAFRFAPGAVIVGRSPYVQNTTVITQETSEGAGDAGRGAWIDGSEVDSNSIEASMLFHSCTFIVPNADAILMTNGVRVEWLNSFTYFANRGLYAFNGSTGRVTYDGSTVNYGAELRSIGSASVYGNYGAVADGADTLMYLIMHNLAYIGLGTDSDNDRTRVIAENETVELNGGKIHYQTTDHLGTFRVGDNFFVNFETGTTSVDVGSLGVESLSGLVINSGDDRTIINGSTIDVGNLRIRNNFIEALDGNLNISSAADINLNDDTNISNNLDVTGNLTFGGNLNLLGNQLTDTLKLNVDFDQDFNPNQDLTFDLGSETKEWVATYLSEITSQNIRIFDNVITTTESNSDLELIASGTGIVSFQNNTIVDNDLQVDTLTATGEIFNMTGNVISSGNIVQDGDYPITGSLSVDGKITTSNDAQFENILIQQNFITTTDSNSDLELRASGTGIVLIDNNDVLINGNVTANSVVYDSDLFVGQQLDFTKITLTDITIQDNFITTNASNANLELGALVAEVFEGGDSLVAPLISLEGGTSATTAFASVLDGGNSATVVSGTPPLVVFQNDVQIENNLSINGSVNLLSIDITGILTHSGNRNQTGNYSVNGDLTIDNVFINDNYITSTGNNQNLIFKSPVSISDFIDSGGINDPVTGTIDGGNPDTTIFESILDGGDPTIALTNTVISVPFNDFYINNDLTVAGSSTLNNVSVNGSLIQTGNRTQTGNVLQTGQRETSAVEFTVDVDGTFLPAGDQTYAYLYWTGTDAGGYAIVDQIASLIDEGDEISLYLNGELIITDTVLGNGAGKSYTPGDTIGYRVTNGWSSWESLRPDGAITGDVVRFEVLLNTQLARLVMSGDLTVNSRAQFENISIDGNVITTTQTNSDLELSASGTGTVRLLNKVIVDNDLFASSIVTGNITIDADLVLNEIVIPPSIIEIDDNFISTKISNADLDLRANGTGLITSNNDVRIDNNLTVTGNTSISNLDINGTLTQTGNRTQVGEYLLDGNIEATIIDSASVVFENITLVGNILETTLSNSNLELRASNLGKILIDSLEANINVSAATLDANKIIIEDSLALESLESSTDIQIFDNVITTTNSNSNLELRANGSGNISLAELNFNNNRISTSITDITFSTENLNLEATGALQLPSGSSELTTQGSIKFDSATGFFEGRNNGVTTFDGVYSSDRKTKVTAHPTNNTIDLTVNNISVGTVAAAGLTIHGIQTDDVSIQGNILRTTVSNSDIELSSPGTGSLVIDDLSFLDGDINNNSAGALTLASTGFGRIKIGGTLGLVVPYGTTGERPLTTPQTGDTRWNTSEQILETWDGNQYITAAGVEQPITREEYEELLLEYTLIFA